MSENIEELWNKRISEETVSQILGLVATVPNKRETPLKNDLEGHFNFWFDGGACISMTGFDRYCFKDGTVADVGTCNPILSVDIKFADKRKIRIQQQYKK